MERESRKPPSRVWISSPTKTCRAQSSKGSDQTASRFTQLAEESAGASDADVLAAADHAGLILITQDQDFGELAILRHLPVAGVVLLEIARLPLKAQVERVAQFIATENTNLVGNFTVIEPARVRVRPLPDSSA